MCLCEGLQLVVQAVGNRMGMKCKSVHIKLMLLLYIALFVKSQGRSAAEDARLLAASPFLCACSCCCCSFQWPHLPSSPAGRVVCY